MSYTRISLMLGLIAMVGLFRPDISTSALRETSEVSDHPVPTTETEVEVGKTDQVDPAAEAISSESLDAVKTEEVPVQMPAKPKSSKRIDRADAFVAGADWEFDGFVSGGQGQSYRSMYYLNDLIYLNIGTQQGLAPGDKVGIYRRGDRIRDPQSGRFLGYEVRRVALSRVTNRVDDETCSVRISTTFEPVEIGDLVRREE